MLTDSHEKKEAWRQIWFLKDRDKDGNYNYRKGITEEERNELLDVFYDFLDYERAQEAASIGKVLAPPDNTPDNRKASEDTEPQTLLDIHDPKHYSFGEGKLWIPHAEDLQSGAKRGRYAKGYPTGMVLHWTAGHRNGLQRGNELMRSTGMLYLIGDKDGNIGQSDSLVSHGYHAGKSSHKYANGYVSDEFVGLELQAAGTLTKKGDKYYSWFNVEIPNEEVRYSKSRENIAAGNYHLYTEAQMLATRKLVAWLFLNNPNVFSVDRVVGHDEVSPGRKTDPGGSTIHDNKVLTMSALRKIIWNDIDKINELRKK